jgi:hypothetical protein
MSYPTTPKPSSIKITSEATAFVSVTQNLRRQVRTTGAQRWNFELTYPPLNRSDFAPLWAFVISQKGKYGSFTFIPPIYGNTSGTASGTLLVNNGAGYAVGSSTIACDGLTGTLKAGDFIKFGGHDKVYMITADATTSLSIEPSLITALVDDEAISYNSVSFTVSLDDKVQKMVADNQGFTKYSVKLVEAF